MVNGYSVVVEMEQVLTLIRYIHPGFFLRLFTDYICLNLVDEWDFAEGRFIQSIKMPANSGPVSYVKSVPNNKHLIWYVIILCS